MGQIRKLLIVDDDEHLASLIQLMLENEGYEAMTSHSGGHGYLTYLLFKPDLVITDVQMPGINGLELMHHIRVHDPVIKTIYMTGDPDLYRLLLEEQQQRYGATVVKKPFSKAKLMQLLSE